MSKRYGLESLRNEFYHYGYEHKDMLGCVSDALARTREGEDFAKEMHHIRFDLCEVWDDLTYKHAAINKLIGEVRQLRKELYGRKK